MNMKLNMYSTQIELGPRNGRSSLANLVRPTEIVNEIVTVTQSGRPSASPSTWTGGYPAEGTGNERQI